MSFFKIILYTAILGAIVFILIKVPFKIIFFILMTAGILYFPFYIYKKWDEAAGDKS